jgi:hypothetical protein
MIIALDIDGVVGTYPKFFEMFIPAMQSKGAKVGILTGRPESDKNAVVKALEGAGLKLDFYLFKPQEFEKFPNGVWKAVVCRYLGVDFLFDDFQHDDPEFVSDFVDVVGNTTVPFTTFHYDGKDGNGSSIKDYVEQIVDYLKEHTKK